MSNPAETYESYMVPVLFEPCARHLLALAAPASGERVLDVGCGTGIAARSAAPSVGSAGSVTGVDLSPHMLAVARRIAERDGLPVVWREGRAEALPVPDRSVDLVVCQHAIQFFADRDAALAEMHRVLVDGGRLALSAWQGLDRHPFYELLHRAIERRLGASSVQDIFALGDDSRLTTMLARAGFRDIRIHPLSLTARFPDPHAFLAGEIDVDTAAIPAMQHLDAEARREMAAAIASDMDGPLRDVTDADHVVLPFHAHIAVACR